MQINNIILGPNKVLLNIFCKKTRLLIGVYPYPKFLAKFYVLHKTPKVF